MSKISLEDLPPTPFEIQRERDIAVSAENDIRHRLTVAAANRRLNIPEPRAGDKIFVIPARGIKQRTRAGIRFDGAAGERRLITVVDASDAEIVHMQRTEKKDVVNEWGAEQILDDKSLTVFQTPAARQDAERLEAENTSLRDENEKLREAVRAAKATRDARKNAEPNPDGGPSRLPAGRAAAPPADAEESTFGSAPAKGSAK